MSNIDFNYQEKTLKTETPNTALKVEKQTKELISELEKIAQQIKEQNSFLNDLPIAYSAYMGYKTTTEYSKLTNISSVKIIFYIGDIEKIYEINKSNIIHFSNINHHILDTETLELENMSFNMTCIHNTVTLQNIRNTFLYILPPYVFTIDRNYTPQKGFFYIPKYLIYNQKENRFVGDIYKYKKEILKIVNKMKDNQFFILAYESSNTNHAIIDQKMKFYDLYKDILEQDDIKKILNLSNNTFKENNSYVTKDETSCVIIYKNQNSFQISEFAILQNKNISPKIFFRDIKALGSI